LRGTRQGISRDAGSMAKYYMGSCFPTKLANYPAHAFKNPYDKTERSDSLLIRDFPKNILPIFNKKCYSFQKV
jgi:hypothetical protein